ncbi:MAG TPA: nucleotide pyrophosphatase [Planctomycetaceae bacterium]|nr:nucleotide pyrophosphatase [Planctomycetaceae bacterium]
MTEQRTVVGMIDGLGMTYFKPEAMPYTTTLAKSAFFKQVSAVFPSVTNVNNVSICCGEWPENHGIIANSYFDTEANEPAYMNAAELIRVPTMFQRAAQQGKKSALLTSKRKTIELLSPGTEIAVAAECPTEELIEKFGQPGDIYSCEINFWLWQVALDILKNRPDISVIYVHTTDYPMHMWPPEDPTSVNHLQEVDRLISQVAEVAPDAALFLTADHGMNVKTRAWDLRRVMIGQGLEPRFVLSPERDYYIKHHRNLAGCSYIWLNSPDEETRAREILNAVDGVEDILSHDAACERFHLAKEHVGDLVALADQTSMFGDLEVEFEELAANYRNHGSLYEMEVPLLIHNYIGELPAADNFTVNKDLTTFLYR